MAARGLQCTGTSAAQEQPMSRVKRPTQVALSLLTQERDLDEPWAHPAFCTWDKAQQPQQEGSSSALLLNTALAHLHLHVLHFKPLSPRRNAT